MIAVEHTRYGPPTLLRLVDVPKPIPRDDQILVRVHAATVNRTDCAILRAKPWFMRLITGLRAPRRPVLGTDFAGVVEAVGKQVRSFAPGDRVFGFDDKGLCSHAEYLVVSADEAVATIPDGKDFDEAASCIEGAHYALNFINKVNLRAGHEVLVNGATGAIGCAAVQISKSLGARVTAVCGARDLELARSLGADRVIDYHQEDFTRSGGRYDFVFDTVGKSSFGRCRRLLRPRGVYLSSELGFLVQNPLLALVTPLLRGRRVAFPVPVDRKASVLQVRGLLESDRLRAVIDRTHPLEQVTEAFRYVETGQKVGTVLLAIAPPGSLKASRARSHASPMPST